MGNWCAHFRQNASMPNILTPRVSEDFVIQEVSTNFVHQELEKLKPTKSTGLDGIPAKLLKNAAPEEAKPLKAVFHYATFFERNDILL